MHNMHAIIANAAATPAAPAPCTAAVPSDAAAAWPVDTDGEREKSTAFSTNANRATEAW